MQTVSCYFYNNLLIEISYLALPALQHRFSTEASPNEEYHNIIKNTEKPIGML